MLELDSCYCPYQDCSVLVFNECHGRLKKVECPYCKKSFCFQCKIPWHTGFKCSESGQLRDRNDVLVGELIEDQKWTRCYNCGHSVERVSGCRDITCKCGARFCYLCGRRSHMGPCKLRCCALGDACSLFYFALLVVLCFLLYYQVQLLKSSV